MYEYDAVEKNLKLITEISADTPAEIAMLSDTSSVHEVPTHLQ